MAKITGGLRKSRERKNENSITKDKNAVGSRK